MTVTVTIRCEREDGQFTVAQTTVPDDLKVAGHELQYSAERIVSEGFVEAYKRLMGLPS